MIETAGNFDELLTPDGTPRHPALSVGLASMSPEVLAERQRHAEEELLEKGITFAVYGHNYGNEKVWPFDIVPRPVAWDEWQTIEVGRQKSLDHFKASMDNARFDPALLRRPEERWGITSNEEQHMQWQQITQSACLRSYT